MKIKNRACIYDAISLHSQNLVCHFYIILSNLRLIDCTLQQNQQLLLWQAVSRAHCVRPIFASWANRDIVSALNSAVYGPTVAPFTFRAWDNQCGATRGLMGASLPPLRLPQIKRPPFSDLKSRGWEAKYSGELKPENRYFPTNIKKIDPQSSGHWTVGLGRNRVLSLLKSDQIIIY